ncbi:LPXTG-motif cell wall anchor domain-containing protein/fibro-slime domain-containing protein [Pseudobutyrivibrio ruminis]|uniref:LPXTG-motif cell wall anchor domain-containing protein/fibro-slime domain-containing protein n=1 Tax=Pseudobutyrivibrio ruminis TaxID=46206 RepID=A0A1H7FBY8_9FIRM|nr:SpaA isopeptide-forming pilin-related protein [Pseudobutyrivibrio ruminis]SEK22857.1 LPXTG-motif cell wall anchor domain-containing protein/fibro-slime domain-containing protein [Pseudobutyrivibrio ruminis]
MKKNRLLNRTLSFGLALALFLSSPASVYAEGIDNASTETILENISEEADASDGGESSGSESTTASEGTNSETGSESKDSDQVSSGASTSENDSNSDEQVNKGETPESSDKTADDAEADADKKAEAEAEADADKDTEDDDEEITYDYESNNDGTHLKKWVDKDGEAHEETEDCEFGEDGKCVHCGYEKEEEDEEITLQDEDGLVTITAKKSVLNGAKNVKVEEITVETDEEQYNEMSDALDKTTDTETSVIDFIAYDIKLFNKDGDEVEPKGEVNVVFNNLSVDGLDVEEYTTEVYHYEDSDNVDKMENVTPTDDGSTVEMVTDHFSTYIVAVKGNRSDNIFDSKYITIYGSKNLNWKSASEWPDISEHKSNQYDDAYYYATFGSTSYRYFYPLEIRVYIDGSDEPAETLSYAYLVSNSSSTIRENFNITSESYTVSNVKYGYGSSYENAKLYQVANPTSFEEGFYNYLSSDKAYRQSNPHFYPYNLQKNINYLDVYLKQDDLYTISGATLIDYKSYFIAGTTKINNRSVDAFKFSSSGGTINTENNPYEGDNYHFDKCIYQGIASNTYSNTFRLNEAITLNNELFPSESNAQNNSNYKAAAYDVNVQFTQTSDGYYELDSSKYNYEIIKDNGESAKDSITHNAILKRVSNVSSGDGMFTPFGNYHFGMDVPIEFTISSNGKTVVNGKEVDTVFEFSGDDDVFVYIDGDLVLDLGGIHGAVTGSIDFATGKVHVEANSYVTGKGYTNNRKNLRNSDLDLYEIVGKKLSQFSKETHIMHVVYFERGASQSNCKIKYNFSPINNKENYTKSITLEKIWDDNGSTTRPSSLNINVYGTYADNEGVKYVDCAGNSYNDKASSLTTYELTSSEGWTKTISGIPVFYDNDTSKIITWYSEEEDIPRYMQTDYTKTFTGESSVTVDDLIPVPASTAGENIYSHLDIELNAVSDGDDAKSKIIESIKDLDGTDSQVSVIGYYDDNYKWISKTKNVAMSKESDYEWRASQQKLGSNSVIAFYVKYQGTDDYKLVIIDKNSYYVDGARYYKHDSEFTNEHEPYRNIAMYYTGTTRPTEGYVDLSGKNLFTTATIECPVTVSTGKGHYYNSGYGYSYPGLDLVLSPKTIEAVSIEATGNEKHSFTNTISTITLTFRKTVIADDTNPYPNGLYSIKLEKITYEDGQEKAEVVDYDPYTHKVFIGNKEITEVNVTSKQGNINWNPGCKDGIYSIYDNQSVTITGLPAGTYRVTEVGAYNSVDLDWFDTEIVCNGQTTADVTATIDCQDDNNEVDIRNTFKKTYGWKLKKVSASNHTKTLQGAEFKLSSNTITYYGLSGDDGIIVWYTDKTFADDEKVDEVADGIYTLQETKAPKEYARSTETWTVSVEKYQSVEVKKGNVTIAKTDSSNNIIEVEFENEVAYTLPETGGSGVYVYTIGGILLMIAGALLLYKNKNNKSK